MTGKGSIAITTHRRLRLLVLTQVLWLALVCVLGAWWGTLALNQARKIAELEVLAGFPQPEVTGQWLRTSRMLFWESLTFVGLVVFSTGFLFWLYWRDLKRSRGIQAFFASVTHELRTPLTSIRLQAESIAENLAGDTTQRELVDRLLEDTMRLEGQVERTLELARVEGGGPVFLQAIPLQPWAGRLVQSWKAAYGSRIRFVSEIEDLTISADPAGLQVILKNLLENSFRHSKAEDLEVRIRAWSSEDGVHLSFEDNGQGYSGRQEQLGKLFHRGKTSQGSGVGLYLIEVLMKKMGGKAVFGAKSDGGFRVDLVFVPSTEVENG